MSFDIALFHFFNNFAGRNWLLDYSGIFFARSLFFLLLAFAVFFAFRLKDWRQRFYFLSLSLLSVIISRGLLTELIQYFYSRPRPYQFFNFNPLIESLGPSFPSGHAVVLFSLGISIFLFRRRWGAIFLFLSLLVSLARIFVGVHWPSDIFTGIIIGSIIPIFVNKLLKKTPVN